jgi:hypothetical protein
MEVVRVGPGAAGNLFYVSNEAPRRDAAAALMSVPVQPGDAWSAGPPVKLFDSPALLGPGGDCTYDASPDAQRFLVISAPTQPAATAAPRRLVIVQNWTEELKRIPPAR